jgi:hypothetical protein
MTESEFELLLNVVCQKLTREAQAKPYQTSKEFENRVREVARETINNPLINIDFDPHPQAFPDIAISEFGIEVKFTTNDTWRSVANSVLETNRIEAVKKIYIERSLKLLEPEMLDAAQRMDDALFVEYWGESVLPEDQIAKWLEKADELAHGWIPSRSLFLEYQRERLRAKKDQ